MELEQRVEKLERINMRYRLAFLVIAAGVPLATSMGMAQKGDAGELVLKTLVIQDEEGRDRILMSDGQAIFLDTNGRGRISIETTKNEARVNLF